MCVLMSHAEFKNYQMKDNETVSAAEKGMLKVCDGSCKVPTYCCLCGEDTIGTEHCDECQKGIDDLVRFGL